MSADDLSRREKYVSAAEWRVRHGSADDLLARAQTQLDMFERRGTTAVPGTVSIVRDLAAEVERLRTELSHVRPVVDAAVAWAEAWAEASGESDDDKRRALLVAVGRLWRETQEAGR